MTCDFADRLGELCLESGDIRDREALEAHLLVCDHCWADFQRFCQTVHILRAERTLSEPLMAADLIELTGYGSRLQSAFAGHRFLVLIASVAFAVMMGLALPVEVAYEWPTYGRWATFLGGVIALTSFGVSVLAFSLVPRHVRSNNTHGLVWSILIFGAWALGVVGVLLSSLPNEPIVQAQFQTMTGALGWLKNVGQALQLPLLSLVPFHFVVSLQLELQSGRSDRVLGILTNSPIHVIPRGSFYPRPAFAAFVAFLFAVWWIIGTAHLLENLQASAYLALFMSLATARVTTVVLTLLIVWIWYVRTLNEIKRETLTVSGGRKQAGLE